MREIKFRAWIKQENKMVDVSYLDFVKCGFPHWKGKQKLNEVAYRKNKTINVFEGDHDQFTLMQYTGLKDKNGVEIYEHDLLQHPNGLIAEIKFVPEHAAFLAHYSIEGKAKYDYLEGDEKMKHCEVIGNIYENPELKEA